MGRFQLKRELPTEFNFHCGRIFKCRAWVSALVNLPLSDLEGDWTSFEMWAGGAPLPLRKETVAALREWLERWFKGNDPCPFSMPQVRG
ncbi:MAG: hypothetical protein OXC72_04365 [Roseovarius sp.]|nr:hypothetical protein [Roseovarius sp.]